MFSAGSFKDSVNHSGNMCSAGVLAENQTCWENLFSKGAFKDKSFGEDVFSRGACKDQTFGEDLLSGGICKQESCA